MSDGLPREARNNFISYVYLMLYFGENSSTLLFLSLQASATYLNGENMDMIQNIVFLGQGDLLCVASSSDQFTRTFEESD